jgi:parallel beta-helix repeat protein
MARRRGQRGFLYVVLCIVLLLGSQTSLAGAQGPEDTGTGKKVGLLGVVEKPKASMKERSGEPAGPKADPAVQPEEKGPKGEPPGQVDRDREERAGAPGSEPEGGVGPEEAGKPGKGSKPSGSVTSIGEDVSIAAAVTYTVTTTGDGAGSCSEVDPGEFSCDTLRAAITAANANSGTDTIRFDIADSVLIITVGSDLPTITEAVIIDGTPPGGKTNQQIVLSGGYTSSSTATAEASQAGPAARAEERGEPKRERPSAAGRSGGGAGASGDPGVLSGPTRGLLITGGGSTVKKLTINGFAQNGIVLQAGGGNTIQGNKIGTDAAGTSAVPNGRWGVLISGSPNNTIGGSTSAERNVISANGYGGLYIRYSGATGNMVQSNYIGTNAAGDGAMGNGTDWSYGCEGGVIVENASNNTIRDNLISANCWAGVQLWYSGATNNLVAGNKIGTNAAGTARLGAAWWQYTGVYLYETGTGNVIGGTSPVDRNVISGNDSEGIYLYISTGAVVQGNYIGTNAAGTGAIANNYDGVVIWGGGGHTIGGSPSGAGNLISGNDDRGISLYTSTGVVVQGNYIGTNAAGTGAIANGLEGVYISGGGGHTIGGSASGAGNLISGNSGIGVNIEGGSGHTVQGNYIGTNAAGTGAIANDGAGVSIWNSTNNIIGGTGTGEDNTIANNSGIGVRIVSGTGHRVRGNSIYDNGGLGIDLYPFGVTPNDRGDKDKGANNLQNFPVLSVAYYDGSDTLVEGILEAAPNTSYTIDIYDSDAQDPSGYGEGQYWVGAVAVTTDGRGNATFSHVVTGVELLYVTATATDPSGNTSEFSASVPASTSLVAGLDVGVSAFRVQGGKAGATRGITLRVKNHGTGAVSDVDYAVSSAGGPSRTYAGCSGTISSLAAGATATIGCTVEYTISGTYWHAASVAVPGDSNLTNNSKLVSSSAR